MKIAAILTSLILIAIAQDASANPLLHSYSADYVVKYDGVSIGKSTTILNIQQNQYRLCVNNITSAPFISGTESECSTGTLINHRVIPLIYTYLYQHDGKKQMITINFDWQKNLALIQTNHSHWQTVILPGTQDKLSYQLEMRDGLTHQQQQFTFPVADGGKIKTYQYKVIGQEKITTPLQTFIATKITRLPIPGKETVVLWMAPSLNNIAVRVEKDKHIMDKGSAEIINYHA